jgi:hypothetical protein
VAGQAPQVVLCSNQDGQTRQLRRQFQSFCEFVNGFFRIQAQTPAIEIFGGICSRFSEAVRVFYFKVSHRPFTRIMSGLYRGTGIQGELNKVERYASTTRRRRQMNDFWKLEDLGIPSDAARQIREQHEKELAAERDARRQTPARDGRGQTPKRTDCLRGLSSLRA